MLKAPSEDAASSSVQEEPRIAAFVVSPLVFLDIRRGERIPDVGFDEIPNSKEERTLVLLSQDFGAMQPLLRLAAQGLCQTDHAAMREQFVPLNPSSPFHASRHAVVDGLLASGLEGYEESVDVDVVHMPMIYCNLVGQLSLVSR